MSEKFEIYVKTDFSAAHKLDGYPGDCARTHGHNWIVEAYVRCSQLNAIGIGIDFRDVKRAVKEVISDLDHSYLNELAPFSGVNPSSENIAKLIYQELSKRLNGDSVVVSKVNVCETEGACVCYWEE